MAFASSSTFVSRGLPCQAAPRRCRHDASQPAEPSRRSTPVLPVMSQSGKQSRRFVPGKGKAVQKTKLEPEEIFVETPPAWIEVIVPALSIFTVIGIIPFIGSVARQLWVRYKFTTRRVSISSGFQGKDQTEIIYRDISKVVYVRRSAGTGDMVLELKDGAKVELRTVPDLVKVFDFIMTKVDDAAKEVSGPA